jgi:hypothetical protein
MMMAQAGLNWFGAALMMRPWGVTTCQRAQAVDYEVS